MEKIDSKKIDSKKIIETKFKYIKQNKAALYSFFSMMPKGGDLHHHYSGSIYTESYIDKILDVKNNYWISLSTLNVKENDEFNKLNDYEKKDYIKISSIDKNQISALRYSLLREWSIRDTNQVPSKDEHFFNSFSKFGKIDVKEGLKELEQRAVNQKISYIESMLISCDIKDITSNVEQTKAYNGYLDKINEKIRYDEEIIIDNEDSKFIDINDKLDALYEKFKVNIDKLAKSHNRLIRSFLYAKKGSNISSEDQVLFLDKFYEEDSAEDSIDYFNKNVTYRFQNYVTRNNNPFEVFISMAVAFLSSDTTKYINGVNIVSAENGVNAMRYYNLHMYFYKYFEKKHDKIKYCIHAGEFVSGMVKPEYLGSNIRKSLALKNVNRIGHGVDIIYDNDFVNTIKKIKNKNDYKIDKWIDKLIIQRNLTSELEKSFPSDSNYLAIEINLSSNDYILGVNNDLHPVELYDANNIPLVICTDDEGILRTSITEQYAILANRYNFGYYKILKIIFNSIGYANCDSKLKIELFKKLIESLKLFEYNIDDFIRHIPGDPKIVKMNDLKKIQAEFNKLIGEIEPIDSEGIIFSDIDSIKSNLLNVIKNMN